MVLSLSNTDSSVGITTTNLHSTAKFPDKDTNKQHVSCPWVPFLNPKRIQQRQLLVPSLERIPIHVHIHIQPRSNRLVNRTMSRSPRLNGSLACAAVKMSTIAHRLSLQRIAFKVLDARTRQWPRYHRVSRGLKACNVTVYPEKRNEPKASENENQH